MRRSRRLLLALAAIGGTVALAVGGVPAAAQPADPPTIVVRDGMTQPVFSFADAIEERVWVETVVDTDHDGRLDRVAADISRPRETATRGFKVPVIFEHSPYREDVWLDVPYPSVEVDELPQASLFRRPRHGPAPNLPGSLDDYYVPRGYAVVLGQSVGTGSSDGCPTSGDIAETLGTKAIVDWLNGRAKAWDADGRPVTADWTTGDVGMTGVSYNGTLPNMVATTGVEGLKTIIAVSAISSWYDYYRANGLVVAPGTFQGEDTDILAQFTAGEERATGPCADELARLTEEQDRVTGDYTPFWRARDYLPLADRVRASVFVVHGLNDWNVKTKHFAQWWERLARHHVTRKLWLHQGGHGGPGNSATYTLPDGRSWTYRQTENRWFDHWLWNLDNGITAEPRAIVQRESRIYTTYRDWPDPQAREVGLDLVATDPDQPGTLSAHGGRGGRRVLQRFEDQGRTIPAGDLVADPDSASPNRLAFRSAALDRAVRLSGTTEMRLRLSIDNAGDANLTAYLVDYGPAGSTTAPFVVTRGWMDPQNRERPDVSRPVRRGHLATYRWTLEPKDYIFEAGHRIGVVVFSTDQEYTLLPLGGTRLTVDPSASQLTIPVVGGRRALGL